ncbi:MAG: hypothetical protein CMM86_13430 [Rhodovulum sp.]|nr:hypothetical protein [Rhodovulum sp.]
MEKSLKQKLVIIAVALAMFAGGIYAITARNPSIQHLKDHPKAFSAHDYWSEESLYDTLSKILPKGTQRTTVEKFIGEQRGYYVIGPKAVDLLPETYIIKYAYKNVPPQMEYSNVRNFSVRYRSADDSLVSFGVQFYRAPMTSVFYSKNDSHKNYVDQRGVKK